jgi:hypothetical protein
MALAAAKKDGFTDVVYLDAKTETCLEELSAANIFVVKARLCALTDVLSGCQSLPLHRVSIACAPEGSANHLLSGWLVPGERASIGGLSTVLAHCVFACRICPC